MVDDLLQLYEKDGTHIGLPMKEAFVSDLPLPPLTQAQGFDGRGQPLFKQLGVNLANLAEFRVPE